MELVTVWSGDTHGPARGLLNCPEAVHPIRQPSEIPAPLRLYEPIPHKATLLLRDRLFAAVTEDWQTLTEIGERSGLTRLQARSAIKYWVHQGRVVRHQVSTLCQKGQSRVWYRKLR